MQDPQAKEKLEKDVIAAGAGIIVILFALGLIIKYKFLGNVYNFFFKIDAYIAYFLHKINSSFFPYANDYLQIAKNIEKTEYINGMYVSLINGQWYNIITVALNKFKVINLFLLGIFTLIFSYIFFKFSRVTSFMYEGIKNKQMVFYFREIDKIIQNFKRKTIKGLKGSQFATMDYFPPYMPDDEEWFENYLNNSIEYSQHSINLDDNHYKDIEAVWKSIKKEAFESVSEEMKPLIKYQFDRYMYIDKNEISGNKQELMIFINERNKNYEDIPEKNLFTSFNSNPKIIEYIKKYYRFLYKDKVDIDYTDIILKDLEIYFDVKLFRKTPKFAKTYFNSIKRNQKVETPFLIYKIPEGKLFDEKAEIIAKRDNKPLEQVKEELKKKIENENIENLNIAKINYKNLPILALGGGPDIRFKQPVLKRTYILTPIKNKKINQFETLGTKIVIQILEKLIISDYEQSLKSQIKKLQNEIDIARKKMKTPFLNQDVKKMLENTIEMNQAIISDIENSLAVHNEASRKAKLKELRKTHNFEETYLIALWEYGMTLENLPTGRLSLIKKENLVFWYALTSLGRPFVFKAGMPIIVLKEIEKEINSKIRQLEEKYKDVEKIDEIIEEDFLNKLKEEALNYQDFEDEEIPADVI